MANKKKIFDRLENLNIPNSSKNEIFNLIEDVEKGIDAGGLTKVTYAELKEMRDNGSLAVGNLYRITDYEFTTKQSNTKSAGNVFDIIVLATAENQLSELARAVQHEGDTYFNGNNLGAWELWYDLDNNTSKYEWADAENGKGVIYRMIDDKDNDCPYDFKNALFLNTTLTTIITTDKYYYTFSYVIEDRLYDGSANTRIKGCYGNSMEVHFTNNKKTLNLNVFRNTSFTDTCSSNIFNTSCNNNTFGSSCYRNTFGSSCYKNTFNQNCYCNNFRDYCYNNTFKSFCQYNTFGHSCSNNTFGYNFNYNTFGNDCDYNTFGSYCHHNIFGQGCSSNIFGDYVSKYKINLNKTSITLNDEYYDDGSGQLVPIKHPDLSTQPSILPYKFMGQYVYEQLIPVKPGGSAGTLIGTPLNVNEPIILRAELVGMGTYKVLNVMQYDSSTNTFYSDAFDVDVDRSLYFRLVYTSMPKEGDYYGYNSY